ncbi:ABC transporter permease [Herbiconiux sp. L3-i23]|uniref:ABC transporter permease n=1 Tax=Herbiconiux sp. L3-i23 TaxID=2905871 RepID=UPI002054417C|nr:ABC transporter permease [Herbiconiux sp. L3-i23]BDI23487.1 monosaccharide-transporting ATPase [Herbiconiux sp. L3-i23]
MSTTTGTRPTETATPPRASTLKRLLTNNTFWIFAVDIVLIAFFWAVSIDNSFLGPSNVRNLMSDSATALLLGVAIAFLLGAGEFDISLGANLILASVVAGLIAVELAPYGLFVIIVGSLGGAIVTGMIIGFINGVIVTRLHVNSLIATLASMGIVTGVAFIVSNGTDVTGIPPVLQDSVGLNNILGIPLPFLISILVWGLAWAALKYTRFGLHVVAMGSSRAAADRAGLRTKTKITTLFTICGGIAGLAGFIDITRFAATNIAGHTQDSLSAITAAVIGGTLLAGGVISIVGLLGGVILAVILANGLIVIGVSSYYQLIIVGAILIVAVWLDHLKKGEKSLKLFAR